VKLLSIVSEGTAGNKRWMHVKMIVVGKNFNVINTRKQKKRKFHISYFGLKNEHIKDTLKYLYTNNFTCQLLVETLCFR
jgi:hypothetical protein